MNDKTNEVLTQLASKLGVTVEYLWRVLVQGQHAEAAVSVGTAFVSIVIVGFCIWLSRYALIRRRSKHDEWTAAAAIVGIVVAVIFSFVAVYNAYYAGFYIISPEYMALLTLLDKLK